MNDGYELLREPDNSELVGAAESVVMVWNDLERWGITELGDQIRALEEALAAQLRSTVVTDKQKSTIMEAE